MLKHFLRPGQRMRAAGPDQPSRPAESATAATRRALIERITEFLLAHQLDVTRGNLSAAQAAFSGADLALASRIAEQELAGRTIDQAWLDAAWTDPANDDDVDSAAGQQVELERLMTRLDGSLAAFSAATERAGGATSAYGDSLQEQVGRLGSAAAGPAGGEVLAGLVGIARAMLDRTREVESEMKRSTAEAGALRASLDRARREADIDHLTGLPNRRAFEAQFQQEIREAQAGIEHLSVAICDIDHFKKVNDVHGHDTGDRVIQAVAQVLAQITDEKCHVARHGGEEFVMLLRGHDVPSACEVLDRARGQLARKRFVNRMTDDPIGQVTFSGGVANVFGHNDPRDALRAADKALYRAKAEGRNRICA